MSYSSTCDDDYRRKHEQQIHNGKRIAVKHHRAPTNPFETAKVNFEKKVRKNSFDLNNITFQSYNFASSMSGRNLGIQAMLTKIVGRTIPFIPCQAHRINTFIKHSCSASVIISNFFSVLEGLYVFFTSNTKPYFYYNNKLLEVDGALKLRNLSKTRWTVWTSFEYILDVLKKILLDTNIDKKN